MSQDCSVEFVSKLYFTDSFTRRIFDEGEELYFPPLVASGS